MMSCSCAAFSTPRMDVELSGGANVGSPTAVPVEKLARLSVAPKRGLVLVMSGGSF